MEQKLLAAPITIRGIQIKNRIAVPAMADFGMTEEDGTVNERHLERYGAYAKNDAGLVIIEACAVSKMPEPRNTIGIFDDRCISGMTALAKKVKQNGSVSLVQIMETGLCTMAEESIAQISREKFVKYKEDFVTASVRVQKAGFDGIEIHAAHGMYLNEIIETSTRNDEYGGTFENRIRILKELIEEIRKACGSSFLISVRFGNRDLKELVEIAKAIQEAGADLLDVSTGMGRYLETPANFSYDSKIYAASLVKRIANIPVICVGDIMTGQQAEEILEEGISDMIAVGRGFLCDPAWARKALIGEIPNLCRKCRSCQWYIDGRRCPAILQQSREE